MKNAFRIVVVILLAVMTTFEVLNYFKKESCVCGVSDNSKVVDVAYSTQKHEITDSLGNKGVVVEFLANCKVVLVDTIWYCSNSNYNNNTIVVNTVKSTKTKTPKKDNPKDPFLGHGPDSVKDTKDTSKVFRSIEIISDEKKESPKDSTPVSSVIIQNNYNNYFGNKEDEPKLESYVFKKKNTVWPAIYAGTGALIFGLNEVGIHVRGWRGNKDFPNEPLKFEFDKKYTSKNVRNASIAMMGIGAGFEAWNLYRNYKGKKDSRLKPITNESGTGVAWNLN